MMQHITHALRSVQTGDTSISPNISVSSHQKSTATNSLFLTAGEGAAPAVLMCWARRGAAQQGFPRSLQRCIYRSLISAPSPRSGMPTLPCTAVISTAAAAAQHTPKWLYIPARLPAPWFPAPGWIPPAYAPLATH